MTPAWINIIMTGISALVGGFVGGCTIAYKLGSWREKLVAQVRNNTERLNSGAARVQNIPVLKARIDVLIEELRAVL